MIKGNQDITQTKQIKNGRREVNQSRRYNNLMQSPTSPSEHC